MFRLGKKFLSRKPPLPVKGKFFDTRFGLIHVQTGKKNFCQGNPPLVKGKIFDTRFGLIHVQTGEKIFCRETPSPPSKGKIFWHQIWLDTCSDWGKNFLSRPPPPSKGKIFWHQIWLDTCSDWEKKFLSRDHPPPRNSTDLLWLRGGRYASSVHAGGLSCYD